MFLEDLPQKIRSLNIDKYKIIILYTSENTVVYNSVRRIYNNKQLDKMEIDILNQENLLLEFLKAHSSDNCVIVTIANTETIKRVIEICEKLDIVCFINVPTDWSFKDMKLAPLYFDVFDDNKTILNMYNPYYTFSISEEYTIDTFIDKYLELLFNFFIIDDACWVEIFKNFVIEMRVAIEKYLEKGKHSKLRLICMNYVSERELLYYSKSENIFIVDTMVDKYINTNDRYFKTSLRSIIFLRWLQYMQVKAEDKKIFASKISEIFLETETIKNTPKEYDKITKSIRRFENIFLNFGFLSNVDDIKAYEDVNIRELAESIKKDPNTVYPFKELDESEIELLYKISI